MTLVAALGVLAGCTGAPTSGSASSTTRTVGPKSPAQTAVRTSVTLACSDATSGSAPSRADPVLGGASLEGYGDRQTPVALLSGGVRAAPALASWSFRKTPVFVPAGAGPVTLTVSGPDAALAWVPAGVWTAGVPDLTAWTSTSVTFAGCPGPATYLGGVLASRPEACVTLTARATRATGSAAGRAQRLDGRACAART